MRKCYLIIFLCCLVGLIVTSAQAAAPRYQITKIADGIASDINNRGQVVGQHGDGPSGRAFIWHKGKLTILPDLKGSQFSHALAINDRGQVVGISSLAGGERKDFFWSNGKVQELGITPGSSETVRINNKGEALLTMSKGGNLHSILWQNGRSKDLGNWYGMDLNDSSQIVGVRSEVSFDFPEILKKPDSMSPVAWRNGKLTKAGENGGMVVHLNNRGDMIIRQFSRNAAEKLILLSNGKRTDITRRHQHKVIPVDLNNKKQIVGTISTRGAGDRAALWQNGQWFELNNLIPKNSGWVLYSAQGINEQGQIVGHGAYKGVHSAFLLTPAK